MRRFAALITTLALSMSGLVFSPAHAIGVTYLCTTGFASSSTPNFTIISGVVSAGESCLGAVVIPAGVTSIGDSAFYGATFLTSITIPDGVTQIGNSAFYGATSLTSITLPDTATIIGANAFYGATSLTSITIPDTVTSIGVSAFYATSLTSVTLPSGLLSLERGVFDSTLLTSITIPDTVTSIGQWAFYGTFLTSIIIPSSVRTIGRQAFYASSLTDVHFLGNAPTMDGIEQFLYVASGAKAHIKSVATGFTTSGTPPLWNGLVVEVDAETNTPLSPPAPIVANGYRADKLGTVYFAPLSSKLSKAAKKQIEAAVIANPSAVYKITGYVQKSIFARNAKNDADLSLARAKAIETYLASLGAGVTFTVVVDAAGVPAKNGKSDKARRATLYAMTPVVQ